jgi:hypothetical protein
MLQRNIWKWCFAIFLGLVISLSTFPLEAVEVSQGPAPMVQAQEDESETVVPFFHMSDDGPPLRPNHPPINQIPPMDMPDDSGQAPASTEPRMGILYNAETNEIRLSPIENPAELLEEFTQGGGYNGADGGPGIEEWESTFYTMSLISNTGDSPWRMNAKVVLRFQDSGGTNHYAVCSGTMRDAEVVLTAGHCVYDRSHSWGWAQEAWVYPGWDGVGGSGILRPRRSTYRVRPRDSTFTLTGWANSGIGTTLGLIHRITAVGVLWVSSVTPMEETAAGLATTYNNASYPAEDCGRPDSITASTCITGRPFDSCPEWNRLRDTSGGCLTPYGAG